MTDAQAYAALSLMCVAGPHRFHRQRRPHPALRAARARRTPQPPHPPSGVASPAVLGGAQLQAACCSLRQRARCASPRCHGHAYRSQRAPLPAAWRASPQARFQEADPPEPKPRGWRHAYPRQRSALALGGCRAFAVNEWRLALLRPHSRPPAHPRRPVPPPPRTPQRECQLASAWPCSHAAAADAPALVLRPLGRWHPRPRQARRCRLCASVPCAGVRASRSRARSRARPPPPPPGRRPSPALPVPFTREPRSPPRRPRQPHPHPPPPWPRVRCGAQTSPSLTLPPRHRFVLI